MSPDRANPGATGPVLFAPGADLGFAFRLLWRRRTMLVATTLTAAVLTYGASFLLAKWYRATAVILPPEESDLLSNLSSAQRALSKFPTFGVLPDYWTPADIYKAVLTSRTVAEDVIHAHDLQRVYRLNSFEKTLKELKTHTKVKINPDGTIVVQVEDRDRNRSAAMANTYLEALDRYNVEKRNSQAHRTRLFLERRVQETDSTLRASEATLRSYEELHHTVAPPTATSPDVRGTADLLARKIFLEVRLGTLRGYLREDNEEVIQARMELDQLNHRIANLPALETELARLIRDAKIQEQLYLLLTSELEQARIREHMDTPTVQVLDPATPPERHTRPRRIALAGGAGALAFAVMAFWILGREASGGAPAA